MKNAIMKLMPFVVGGGLGILLFHPPAFLRELGFGAYLVMGLLVAMLFVLFIGFLLLANFPADLRLDAAATATVPAELQTMMSDLINAGFTMAGAPRSVGVAPPALLVPFVHSSDPIYASLFRTGTVPAKVSYDCVSIFEGERGGLTTGPDLAGTFVPGAPGSLRQVFPSAKPAQLLDHHRRGLAYLRTRGIEPRPVSSGTFDNDFRQAMSRGRRAFLQRPILTTLVSVWRSLTRSTPHLGSIEKQSIAEKEIKDIIAGLTV